jgi:catechol 2,3-dioxygenase-like lactoylglutathione lyase family enzyme
MTPKVNGVLETGIYVEDVATARAFYERVFGFEPIFAEERMCTLAVAPSQVLIIFKRGGTLAPVPAGDSVIPPHDGGGPQHFAFAIAAADLDMWKAHLMAEGVAIESTVKWPKGGTSLYFRDPDGLLVELATPGLWANY